MGECHAAKADYPKALEAYQTALRMREDHFGPSHSMVANTLINLSSMYTDMKEYEQAKAHIDRAMQIYENESEPNFLTRSIMYSNAARTYGALDLTDECMAFNYKALRLGKEGLGPRHPDTMVTQFNIAQISIGNKDYDKARELLLEVREAWLESFGERHPWMALCLNSIGKLKTIAGDPQGGLELCLKALNILHDIHGEDHPWCSEIEKNIALARKEAGMEP
jgi:tetratricopeptide (TPR) repeat protein